MESSRSVALPTVTAPPQTTGAASAAVAAPKQDPKADQKPAKKTRGRKGGQASAAAVAGGIASAFAKRPAKGVERVFVSYRGVLMVSAPDEARMVARLERGDEIEIIGSLEGHLNVRTPSGLTGWIPRGTVTGVRPNTPGGATPATQ
jgi:hypothetical protein